MIRRGMRGRELVEVILHESLHAADETKSEEFVEETAFDQSKILCQPKVLALILECPALRDSVREILAGFDDGEE